MSEQDSKCFGDVLGCECKEVFDQSYPDASYRGKDKQKRDDHGEPQVLPYRA